VTIHSKISMLTYFFTRESVGVDDTMISHEVVRTINNHKMLYSKNSKQLT
jgi:hypothetical protein